MAGHREIASISERRRQLQCNDSSTVSLRSPASTRGGVGAAVEMIGRGGVQSPQILRLPGRKRFGIDRLDVRQREQRQHLQTFGSSYFSRQFGDRSWVVDVAPPHGGRHLQVTRHQKANHRRRRLRAVAAAPPQSARTAGCCKRDRNLPGPCRYRAAAARGRAVRASQSPPAARRRAATPRSPVELKLCSTSMASSVCSSTV